MATSLEALFERYRAGGELAALGEIFDRTSAGLLALAVHLVRDPVGAEDLVQATFVAAIEGAGGFQAERRLEPWLAGILARQAARAWRSQARVPEGRPELDASLDPSFAAERRELSEALELALSQLGPRERGVLVRYLEGEKPLDIARSEGRGAGAVRMQVLRGLEKLRRLLPAGLHAVVPLARLPRGLAAVRSDILAHAGGATVLAPAALVPVSIGVLAMSMKLVLAAVAVSAVVFLTFRSRAPRVEPAPPVAPLADAAREPAPAQESRAALAPTAEPAPETREAVSVAADTSPANPGEPERDGLWLVGRVLGLGPGLDPAEVELQVGGQGMSLSGAARADGTYALAVDPLGPRSPGCGLLSVHATHPAWRRLYTEVRIDDELRRRIALGYTEISLDLDLSPRTAVVGHVTNGNPRAALVRDGEIVASQETSDENEGAFALYPREAGAFELLLRVSGRLPLRFPVEVAPQEILDVGTFALEDEGVAIEGHFVPAEFLQSGLILSATRTDLALEEASPGGIGLASGRVRSAQTEVARDGSFRFAGLEPGAYVLSLEPRLVGDRLQLGYPERSVHAPASGVEFGGELGLVTLRLRGLGREVATLLLNYELDPGRAQWANRCIQVTSPRPIEVLVDRRSEFSVSARAVGTAAQWRRLPAGRPARLEEILELVGDGQRFGALELTWKLPPGLLLTRTVRAHWEGPGGGNDETAATAQGCRFERLLPGHHRIVLAPVASEPWEPLPSFAGTNAIEVEIVADRTTSAFVTWSLGGRARFVPSANSASSRAGREAVDAEVRDASGARCLVRFALREYDAEGNLSVGSFATLPLSWPSELEPNLAPGAYTLVLSEQDREPVLVPFSLVAGEIVEVPVVLPE